MFILHMMVLPVNRMSRRPLIEPGIEAGTKCQTRSNVSSIGMHRMGWLGLVGPILCSEAPQEHRERSDHSYQFVQV